MAGMQMMCGVGLSSRIVGSNLFVPLRSVRPLFRRDLKFRVRSMTEDGGGVAGEKEKAAFPIPPQLFSTPPPPPPPPEESTKIRDIMAFNGPGPERINGRLAMIGFVSAVAVELSRGQDIFGQIQNGGIMWFLGTSVILSVASIVPLLKGVSADSRSGGFMTSDAELWNGRFAMLGLIALAYTEYVKGATLL